MEERDLKPGKNIYLDISSQKKPSYEGSKNWIIIQDSDTQKKVFLHKGIIILTEKFTHFLNKMRTIKKNIKIIFCDNACKNNTLEEKGAKQIKEINFEFTSPGTPQKNGVIERGLDTLYCQMRVTM